MSLAKRARDDLVACRPEVGHSNPRLRTEEVVTHDDAEC
jgi:hypothetical protein